MSTLRQLRNFWILWVTTIVLGCFGNAAAQASYKVTDLGAEGKDNLGCAMSLNNRGWTEIMAGNLPPGQQDSFFGTLLNGRALIDVDGFKLVINERGQIAGMATVLSGPDAGKIHAFLATPVDASIGMSIAEVARTHPKINLPANVGKQLLQRFGVARFGQ